jgi:hypothetical protein
MTTALDAQRITTAPRLYTVIELGWEEWTLDDQPEWALKWTAGNPGGRVLRCRRRSL